MDLTHGSTQTDFVVDSCFVYFYYFSNSQLFYHSLTGKKLDQLPDYVYEMTGLEHLSIKEGNNIHVS